MGEPRDTRAPRSMGRRAAAFTAVMALKLIAWAIVLGVPLLAVWGATSLVTLSDGPREWAVAAGVLLFPGIPLAWDVWAERRRRRDPRRAERPRILTMGDRLIFRTLVVGVLFVVPMMLAYPERLFEALTTRGDWFLRDVDGRTDGERATLAWARGAVLGTADGLVWLYDAVHENPYRDDAGDGAMGEGGLDSTPVRTGLSETVPRPTDDGGPPPPPAPSPVPVPPPSTDTERDADTGNRPEATDPPSPRPTAPAADRHWPFPDAPSLALDDVPASATESPEALGAWIAAQSQDELQRARLAHDFIALSVAYDVPALTSSVRPSQQAADVMRTGRGVCEGYARLFDAVARAAGLEVHYVVGDGRSSGPEGEPHAWNAVRVDGSLRLVDVTWDAGYVDGSRFVPELKSLYFLVPGEHFIGEHYPEDDAFQLLDVPVSRGEFHRMPVLSPRLARDGFRVVTPTRSLVEVGAVFEATLGTDGTHFLIASTRRAGTHDRTRCDTERRGDRVAVRCPIATPGTHDILLFTSPVQYGTYTSAAQLGAQRRR